jgi:hypothetical protein
LTLSLGFRKGSQQNVASSSATPATVALVSSEALTVMTPAERSSQHVECKYSTMEGESDAEEDSEAYVSKNDFEITGEQLHTVGQTAIAHEEADNTSGKRAAADRRDRG